MNTIRKPVTRQPRTWKRMAWVNKQHEIRLTSASVMDSWADAERELLGGEEVCRVQITELPRKGSRRGR